MADACTATATGVRRRARPDLTAVRPNRLCQKTSSGFPTAIYLRWNDTVSTTSSTTETTLANSAPPDSETTLAIA